MQGLLTNDIEKPGDGAFIYGAMLTPKGMIVVDGWAARQGTTVTYTVPVDRRDAALTIFTRSVPPRLARTSDRTAEVACPARRAAGTAKAQAAGLTILPAPGRVVSVTVGDAASRRGACQRPGSVRPAGYRPAAAAGAVAARLSTAGMLEAEPVALECARILAGWPRVGAEVDDKTIPQEVRLDELGGVSFTKGCYTGQETVSRLHFRGHVNRHLRGLLFDAEPAADVATVIYQDRDAGHVTSMAWIPELRISGGGRWIGLAMVRREVDAGMVVRAAGRDARVVDLPSRCPYRPARHKTKARREAGCRARQWLLAPQLLRGVRHHHAHGRPTSSPGWRAAQPSYTRPWPRRPDERCMLHACSFIE
jgi:folate-binding protein YgfZ